MSAPSTTTEATTPPTTPTAPWWVHFAVGGMLLLVGAFGPLAGMNPQEAALAFGGALTFLGVGGGSALVSGASA